ncbi:hypothetical protein KHA80_12085 [Anaerobacillus sp. HL2]|nr:hypothetical protein KHA80_12085 [Anaerobacillus sp. HL2]
MNLLELSIDNNALNTIFGLAFQSITASVGNLGATETKEKVNLFFIAST